MAITTKNGIYYANQIFDQDLFDKIYKFTIESVTNKKLVIIHYEDIEGQKHITDMETIK